MDTTTSLLSSTTGKPIRVLIVEDKGILRDGFIAILKDLEDISIIGGVASAELAIALLEKQTVDVILMDIHLGDNLMSGIEATRIICKRWPETQILALTNFRDKSFIKQMLKEGAIGYMLKDTERADLIHAIRSTAKGDNYFSNQVAKILAEPWLPTNKPQNSPFSPEPLPEEITPREKDVLQLICAELTNKEIADKLHISPRTVDTHRRSLLQKIGARNTAGLVVYSIKHGLCGDRLGSFRE